MTKARLKDQDKITKQPDVYHGRCQVIQTCIGEIVYPWHEIEHQDAEDCAAAWCVGVDDVRECIGFAYRTHQPDGTPTEWGFAETLSEALAGLEEFGCSSIEAYRLTAQSAAHRGKEETAIA